MLAASRGHTEACRILLEAGANPLQQNFAGDDAYALALNEAHDATAILILDRLTTLQKISVAQPHTSEPCEANAGDGDADTEPSLDLIFWDAEQESPPPLQDNDARKSASDVQNNISIHTPIDTDSDWSDVGFGLPDVTHEQFGRRGRALHSEPTRGLTAKEKPLSEKDERLAKLKAIAEQMAKAKAGGAVAAPVVEAAAVPVAGKEARKKPTRGLTAKEKTLVKEFERREMSPADAEARCNRLKNLIMLGKERNYLTYAEINDHLPVEMLEAEQIETIIDMINDMGILVYDEAPDAETVSRWQLKVRAGGGNDYAAFWC